MGKSTRRPGYTRLLATLLPIGLTFAPSIAFADSQPISFQTQYQVNQNTESSLTSQTASLKVTSIQTLTLSYRIQVLNYEIAQLYSREQSLASAQGNQSGQGDTTGGTSRSTLISQRNQLIKQLRDLWTKTFGAEWGLKPGLGHGPLWRGGPFFGDVKHGVTIGALIDANQANFAAWLTSLATSAQNQGPAKGDDGRKGRGHGRRDEDGKPNTNIPAASMNAQDLSQAISQITQLVAQIGQIQTQIQQLPKEPGAKGTDGDVDGDAGFKSLSQVQNRILQLQAQVIADLRKWIELAGGTPITPPVQTTLAGVTVQSNVTSVQAGTSFAETVQLIDAAGQPLHQAGVKIDFSMPNGQNDGRFAADSAVTNANGQAIADVISNDAAGTIVVVAQVDGGQTPASAAAPVQVDVSTNQVVKLVAAGSAIVTNVTLGGAIDTNSVIYPETNSGSIVSGDQLSISTSNPSVVALPNPDASNPSVETLSAGQYALPQLVAKGVGDAQVTITDVTAPTHPSLQYTVHVASNAAVGLVVDNPNNTLNQPYSVGAGLDGPFQITVVDAAGQPVPSPTNIVLSAAQVNQIIGAGTAIRPANASNQVSSVQILQGQTSVTVYADGVTAGVTHPTELPLSTIAPTPVSASVVNSSTVSITFNQGLNGNPPSTGDFIISWGTGAVTPKTVSVNGDTVTLGLWSASLSHGQNVSVDYNPLPTDSNPLSGVLGQQVGAFANLTVANPL